VGREVVEQEEGIEHRWSQVRCSSPLYHQTGCQGGNGRRGLREEGEDVKMNEEKDPEEEHEDDGDYEAEYSPARRGVKGKKGKGNGKVGRPKKVKVHLCRCHADDHDHDGPLCERRVW